MGLGKNAILKQQFEYRAPVGKNQIKVTANAFPPLKDLTVHFDKIDLLPVNARLPAHIKKQLLELGFTFGSHFFHLFVILDHQIIQPTLFLLSFLHYAFPRLGLG